MVLVTDTDCPKCKNVTCKMPFTAVVYACYDCMCLYVARIDLSRQLTLLYNVKRISDKEWIIGHNVQAQKNTIWEEALESSYVMWIAKKVLE